MHPHAVDPKCLAQALVREVPEVAHLPALRDINNRVPPSTPSTTASGVTTETAPSSSLQSVLDLAAELLLDPQLTVRVARAVRPLLLDIVARALSGVRNGTIQGRAVSASDNSGKSNTSGRPRRASTEVMPVAAEQAEVVLIVMSRLLPAAPHCLSLALHHWRFTVCPLESLRVSTGSRVGGASVDATEGGVVDGSRQDAPHTIEEHERNRRGLHAITGAAHILLASNVVGASLRELWNWAPFFDLCQHEDILIRWRAVSVVSHLLGLDEPTRRDLLVVSRASEYGVTDRSAVISSTLVMKRGMRSPSGEDDCSKSSDALIIANAKLDLMEELEGARSFFLRDGIFDDRIGPPPASHVFTEAKNEMKLDVSTSSGTQPYVSVPAAAAAGASPRQPLPDVSYNHHPAVADIGGILHPATTSADQAVSSTSISNSAMHFVRTSSASRNLASLSLAMTIARPILLHGPPGSGKSSLAREAARLAVGGVRLTTSASMLELHLDDQTDSKSLLGTHASTDVPGEFAWRPGALTRAAVSGTWVLIEDVDRAPFEVLAALGPLLEGRPLALAGRSRPLIAAPGFRVFGTVTTTGPARVVLGGAADFGALWTHVAVEPLSVAETLQVARIRHPILPLQVSRRLLDTMLLANGNRFCSGGGGSGFASASGSRSSYGASGGREPGVRDFLKLCARVEQLGLFDRDPLSSSVMPPLETGPEDIDHAMDVFDGTEEEWFCSEAQAVPVIMESLEVFAAHLTTKGALVKAVEVLAGQWNVLPSKAIELATTSRPDLVQTAAYLQVGRINLPRMAQISSGTVSAPFAPTSHALRLMETLAASVRSCEPILLVGETGCGKTALVQRLAEGTGRKLVVQNLSLQTDGADLLGGFRPVELRQLAKEILEEFLELFPQLFSATQNTRFCQAITSSFERRQWKRLSAGLRNASKMANDKLDRAVSEKPLEERTASVSNKSRRSGGNGRMLSPSTRRIEWERFSRNVGRFEKQRVAVEGSFAFSFVEGVLVKAIRDGMWVLLDEINLASAETLQRLAGLLEGAEGSLCLTERGDVDPVPRHPDFRLFAAMNPPTDASKKDLPPALRRRFSEVYVPELEDRVDLKRVADGYLAGVSFEQVHVTFTAVDLYLWARGLAADCLSDGAGQRPRYSLRTLVGALSAARQLVDGGFSPKRAMVEGFRGAFETQLDSEGRTKILKGIMKAVGQGLKPADLEKPPRRPGGRPGSKEPWVLIGPFWLRGGPLDPVDFADLNSETKQRRFVLTESVQSTLRSLGRAVASSSSPVLLQGPTSAGKTSIVEYLAARLGHRCVRINNHEHTDIQEYTGSYAADGNGKLAFQEGVLVEALREGHWIILDELNLAPSEVLEALNRLLDHNRELYLSETQETIKPHPLFRLFATQNPPGAYGGRKPLSRAFRNRFMEVYVADIPGAEWQTILTERCAMPPSHCKLLVKVLHELQAQRQTSRLFLGKHSAISPRDLLRWAGRKPESKQQLAEEGYMLLAERLRSNEEKVAMKLVLEEQIGVTLDPCSLYGAGNSCIGEGIKRPSFEGTVPQVNEADLGGIEQLFMVEQMLDNGLGLLSGLQGVAMTRHMRRLFRLSGRCLSHEEPLLLVGESGCGKTTVCQLYSMLLNRKMHAVNCHQNTEAADLLGGLRPLRGRDSLVTELQERARKFVDDCKRAVVLKIGMKGIPSNEPVMEDLSVAEMMGIVKAVWSKLTKITRESKCESSEVLKDSAKLCDQALKRAREMNTDDSGAGGGKTQSDVKTASVSTRSTVASPQLTHCPGMAASDQPSTGTERVIGKSRGKRRRQGPRALVQSVNVSDLSTRAVPSGNSCVGPQGDKIGSSLMLSTTLADQLQALEVELSELKALENRSNGLFEWVDGPLVTAMRRGEMILLDELSLADDAVLERLNSVLEPGRSITLAEKGGESSTGRRAAAETVVAAPGFRVVATMNPGGDFGKRELSPALRSRFTEVWVPPLSAREDMEGVVHKAFMLDKAIHGKSVCGQDLAEMAGRMLDFVWWFNHKSASTFGGGCGLLLSVRDLLSWVGFIRATLPGFTRSSDMDGDHESAEGGNLRPWEAYVHGAALVLIDGMGLGAGLSPVVVATLRKECGDILTAQIPDCPERSSALAQLRRDCGHDNLERQLKFAVRSAAPEKSSISLNTTTAPVSAMEVESKTTLSDEPCIGGRAQRERAGSCTSWEFGVVPFFTPCGPLLRPGLESGKSQLDFSLQAPTTAKNLHRVLRALQVRKAVLLEGSPGVGKTSLVSALAAATGHELVRINLSEQTDASDLFGSDLPVPDKDNSRIPTSEKRINEGVEPEVTTGRAALNERNGRGNGARFAWCDGVFLRALKEGKWVLLDELNLATQSVLEGLNACLDHRAEVYIPEIGRSFQCPSTFKVFAAQNPLGQGGGRKGLPRSFLSRFTKVYVDPLTQHDLLCIAANKFPTLNTMRGLDVSVDAKGVETEPRMDPALQDSVLARMIRFNSSVQEDTMKGEYGRKGSPWEFNLRDVFRWCEAMIREQGVSSSVERKDNIDPEIDGVAGGESWEPWLLVDTMYLQRMRSRADREALLSRFKEAFPEAFATLDPVDACDQKKCRAQMESWIFSGGIGTHPSMKITSEWFQIGQTVLRSGCWSERDGHRGDHASTGGVDAVAFPVFLRRPLQALARCVGMGWPSLVVGHRGSGKTTLIRGLAAAVGARLTEVAMTPSIDVTELLGCFEQADAGGEQDDLFASVSSLAELACLELLSEDGDSVPRNVGSVWDALNAIHRCYCSGISSGGAGLTYRQGVGGFDHQGMVVVDNFLRIVEGIVRRRSTMSSENHLESIHEERVKAGSWAGERNAQLLRCLSRAQTLAKVVREKMGFGMRAGEGHEGEIQSESSRKSTAGSCFRWKDGILVEALLRGDWLVLDSANLCSASVLDRINPLLEPGGVLLLTEGGSASDGDDGDTSVPPDTNAWGAISSHRVIKPHPNFRLFLTADPACGEVSRAMRNRCVEIALLDTPPVVLLANRWGTAYGENSSVQRGGDEHCLTPVTHNVSDLVSILVGAGVEDSQQATAMLAAHSVLGARRAGGKTDLAQGCGSTPRALKLWAELSVAVRSRCWSRNTTTEEVLTKVLNLAYPRLNAGPVAKGESSVMQTALSMILKDVNMVDSGGGYSVGNASSLLAQPTWRDSTENGIGTQVQVDTKLGRLVRAKMKYGHGRTVEGQRWSCLESVVLGRIVVGEGAGIADLPLALEDEEFFVDLRSIEGILPRSSASSCVIAQLESIFARRTSVTDSTLRAAAMTRLARCNDRNEGVLADRVELMTSAMFESAAWADVFAMLSDLKQEISDGLVYRDDDISAALQSVQECAFATLFPFSPRDPRSNRGLYGCLRRAAAHTSLWKPFVMLLNLLDCAVSRRLPVILDEEAQLVEARTCMEVGKGGEVGLGWLGLSCLCQGGGLMSRTGYGRNGKQSQETRLARSLLVPYLLPLFNAVDDLMKGYLCKPVVMSVLNGEEHGAEELVAAYACAYRARDTLSYVLSEGNAGRAEPDASSGKKMLTFSWDLFLVSWRWLNDSIDALTSVSPSALAGDVTISKARAALNAVRARVNAAVVEHAGGAMPSLDTLWQWGARAVAPSSASAADALGRLHRLGARFRVTIDDLAARQRGGEDGANSVSLEVLMNEAHPSLSVSDETRAELVDALCTLQWAASSEVESRKVSCEAGRPVGTAEHRLDVGSNVGISLAENLPNALDEVVKVAQAKFTAAHKGTRMGTCVDGSLDQDPDCCESGERFDGFETEAQERIANATLLVVSGDEGDDKQPSADGLTPTNTLNVMKRWALVQLAPFAEHWAAVEECEVLAALSQLSATLNQEGVIEDGENVKRDMICSLMLRIARLRSFLVASPSLSLNAARPYQTLLWAWENDQTTRGLRFLLMRILPVALDGWGERLWNNLFRTSGAISATLNPPQMIDEGTAESPKGVHGSITVAVGYSEGPAQILELVRSSFLLRLSSAAIHGDSRHSVDSAVDLTLMNASARLGQFRSAMRLVRDLRTASSSTLKPLIELGWARLSDTLCPFDRLATSSDGVHTFAGAMSSCLPTGSAGRENWKSLEVALRQALSSCCDQRLLGVGESLVLPSAHAMCSASKEGALTTVRDLGLAKACTGFGMALIGCLRLSLLLPSCPVDPGLEPMLKKGLLEERLSGVRAELTVRRWCSRMEEGGDLSPEMLPLLKQARRLRDEAHDLGLEAIERGDDRPSFQTLFGDVHTFSRGVGSADRVTYLAQQLACLAGASHILRVDSEQLLKVWRLDAKGTVLREESVWQEAVGSFVGRFRSQFMEAYPDVVTGICDAVETCRIGLRLLAAAAASPPSPPRPRLAEESGPEGEMEYQTALETNHPLVRLQSFLLRFPFPVCCPGKANGTEASPDDSLAEELRFVLDSEILGDDGEGMTSAQHMAVLQAVFSRAENLLLTGCSDSSALSSALAAMDAVVCAWSKAEADEAERKRKEAEIIKYKMQEHVVETQEVAEEARLRALFPDYHSGFEDILAVDTSDTIPEVAAAAASTTGNDDARLTALRHLSDTQLSSLVAGHTRLLLSLAKHRRLAVRRLGKNQNERVELGSLGAEDWGYLSVSRDVSARIVAFCDSYRAAVLLAGSTSSLPACVPQPRLSEADDCLPEGSIQYVSEGRVSGAEFLHLEEEFASSHMIALSGAVSLCQSGKTLLEEVSVLRNTASTRSDIGTETTYKTKKNLRIVKGGVGGIGKIGEETAGENISGVDCHLDFHLDANVKETRLTDGPLAAVLRRVAELLQEFPGHGVLIQLARVADRVRRMPLHSPLAAVLAGVELTLRKAQDWEQHAHRGVSLKDELRALSALVVRWRAIELKSWPLLLDGREKTFVLKANRWWLHLHRLLTGEWQGKTEDGDVEVKSLLGVQPSSMSSAPDEDSAGREVKTFLAPDWPSATSRFPGWLWHGLVSKLEYKERGVAINESASGFNEASLAHARGLFQALDDFIRTSSIGEFFARLQMLRAFSVHLATVQAIRPGADGEGLTDQTIPSALAVLLQGLWQYYAQFSEDVMNTRDMVRKNIEKKLKEEAKLAKWDEQTYYSLAEASEKSHRKLSKLVSQYDEVLEVSVSEVLNRVFTAGVGERKNDNPAQPTCPCTEIPSVGSMFGMVKKVDTAADFVEVDEDSEAENEDSSKIDSTGREVYGVKLDSVRDANNVDKKGGVKKHKPRCRKPSTQTSTSFTILDVCLPEEPSEERGITKPAAIMSTGDEHAPWVQALLLNDVSCTVEEGAKYLRLTARLPALSQRMRSLLRRAVYGGSSKGGRSGGWAERGRPAGFLGAGLAEELCLAVFGRINALRAPNVGKQVKKRAVLDLIGGLRKQGLKHTKSARPQEMCDMVHVMTLPQPFAEDQLVGAQRSWLFGSGAIDGRGASPPAAAAGDILDRGERYYLKGVSELSRLRLEAGAPVSKDITRREAEVMRGLSEHLGLLIMQQRGATTTLESEILSFALEMRALRSLVDDYPSGVSSEKLETSSRSKGTPLPAQRVLRKALETQRQGLRQGMECIKEVQLLLKAITIADPPSVTAPSRPAGSGWGQGPIDAASWKVAAASISELEDKTCSMLARLDRYPAPHSTSVVPLLAGGAVAAVLETQEASELLAKDAHAFSRKYADVIPPAALRRIGDHFLSITQMVQTVLYTSPLLRFWWIPQPGSDTELSGNAESQVALSRRSAIPSIATITSSAAQSATSDRVACIGKQLSSAVSAMLISVQSLCQDPTSPSTNLTDRGTSSSGQPSQEGDGEQDGEELSVMGTALFVAHASSFEQARMLKLWRCANALKAVRVSIIELSEAEVANGWAGGIPPAGEAAAAVVGLLRYILELAEQVLAAGRAVLTGIVAFNKGMAKLQYVILRVFRVLLSKGLCSDEIEETEGDGEGDVDGMKFDDDVEGMGMGEGEGKKDVSNQIEDEEQLLGLKGDEGDKDEAEEAKELGEDEQDNGMEMENDFDGQMFDVPKGDDNDEQDDNDEKEELDREMGDDVGDNADVVDEKLWEEEEDDDGMEEGKEEQEEKFEAGSRLDGEKPEDEIRTKEDEQENGDNDGKEKNGEDSPEEKEEKRPEDGGHDGDEEGKGEDEGNGDEGGLVNDDLEDNYEDKPMGVEVRGEDEAMEDEGHGEGEGEGRNEELEEDDDLPNDLNLDEAGNDDGGEEDGGNEEEDKDDGDDEGEGKEKEGFETLAPENDEADQAEELAEDVDQPQASGNPGAPELTPMEDNDEEEEREGEEEGEDDAGTEREQIKKDEPQAFGSREGGDTSAMLDASHEEADTPVENGKDQEVEDQRENEETQARGGGAPDVRDVGGGGQGQEGEKGEWRRDTSGGEGRGEGQGKDVKRRPETPNPFRDPGDAMRHWHRRLDMLQDKDNQADGDEESERDDDDDRGGDGEPDGGDGKFEYVSSKDEGFSQVLGGSSEERAAETAAKQAADNDNAEEDKMEADWVKDGEVGVDREDKDEVGMDTVDDEQTAPECGREEDVQKGERAEDGDRNRKSAKRRDKDGHRPEHERGADDLMNEGDEEKTVEARAAVTLDSLEEDPSVGTDVHPAQVVTNLLDGEKPATARALREELHLLVEELQLRKRERDGDRDEVDENVTDANEPGVVLPEELWGKLRSVTAGLSQRLCEQLRLVLEPMIATKLQGDYRSGKRINMRRVIPYIASGFRKDKIWLRRTKPAKRDYQILIAIDDSESMADCGAGALALAAMTTVASGLTQLEAGQLAVARFGEQLDLLHAFGEQFTEQAGAKIVSGFTFNQPRTNTAHTLEGVVALLEEARSGFSFSSGGFGARGTPRQLVLLLSDGRFDRENKDRLRSLIGEMNERGQLLVLIVLDKEGDTSILKTREASYVGGKLVLSSYLDKYPFPFYILLNHVESLPETLADALRQWFELLQRETTD